MEKTITIRVEEELYKQIKVEVAMRGISLKEYILTLVKQDLDSKKQ